jgi:hypothetical protein
LSIEGGFILKKIGVILSVFALIFTGCNDTKEEKTSNAANEKKGRLTHLVWTEPSSQVEFTLLNPKKLPDGTVKNVKREINELMPYIDAELSGVQLDKRSSVTITLHFRL